MIIVSIVRYLQQRLDKNPCRVPEADLILLYVSGLKQMTSEVICLRTMLIFLVNKTLIDVTFVLAGKQQNLDLHLDYLLYLLIT